jgi:peptidoglycan hydrolase-like protein with peptidoglycan-binding domain
MHGKKLCSLFVATVFLCAGNQAAAQPRDAAMGLGLGLGLGLLLHEALKPKAEDGPRNPNDTNLGPRSQRRQVKTPDQVAAEQEEQQRRAAEIAEMADIQSRLNTLHFDAGPADGKAGGKTKTAIKEFQRSLNQPATGELSLSQKSMLTASTTAATASPATASSLQPLTPTNSAAPFSPQEPFANATSMLPQPASLTPAQAPLSPSADAPSPVSAHVDASVSVLGVSPMMGGEEAYAALKSVHPNEWCRKTAAAIVCRSSDTTMTDEVIVGMTQAANGARVHSVIRTMQFTTPVARSAIDGQMRQSYPALSVAENGVSASGRDCDRTMQSFRANEFQALKQWLTSSQPDTASVAPLAAACQKYSELAVPAGETVPGLTIALFSGEPLATAAAQAPAIRF